MSSFVDNLLQASNPEEWLKLYERVCQSNETYDAGAIAIESLLRFGYDDRRPSYRSSWSEDRPFRMVKGILEKKIQLPPPKRSGAYVDILMTGLEAYFGEMSNFRKEWPQSYEALDLALKFIIKNMPEEEKSILVERWAKTRLLLTRTDFTQDALLRMFNFVGFMCEQIHKSNP